MKWLIKAWRAVATIPDLLLAATTATLGSLYLLVVVLVTRSRHLPGRRLMVLDSAYSLAALRARDLLHTVEVRDLEGYFDHVWSVHPLVGADPGEVSDNSVGAPTSTRLGERHSFIEGHSSYSPSLGALPLTNLLLAQIALLALLIRVMRREDISIVRVGDPYYQGLLILILRKVHHVPYLVRINGNYDALYEATGRAAYPKLLRSRRLEKKLERIVLPRAALVVAPNDDNLAFALRNGASRDRSAVFRYGNLIHPVHFTQPDQRHEGPELPSPLIICVSRLEPVKFVEDFVHVLSLLTQRGLNVKGVLVGDGSLRARLLDLAARLNVADRLLLVGNRDQTYIAHALSRADVVAAPMMGRALVEAALSATPIVAYETDWHSELVRDGETGLLVPFRNRDAMADAVRSLLEDPENARRLGERARSTARESMDPHSLNQLERLQFERVLADRREASVPTTMVEV